MAGKGMGGGARTRQAAGSSKRHAAGNRPPTTQKVIPEAVANRMARRIAIATGVPSVLGMAVFVVSYLLVSRGVADIPPSATLVASGGCFLLGLLGLSYGVLSASWDDRAGTLLGSEQIGLNIGRVKESLRAMRAGSDGKP